MSERLDYKAIAPAGLKGFGITHSYIKHCGLPTTLIDLVYLRTSLINGCAYCIDMHTRDLIKEGVSPEKVALVPVWYEAGAMFTGQERAALAWAETVTKVSETTIPDGDYQAARSQFSDNEIVDLTIAISLMNAYNRLAVSFRSVPEAVKLLAAKV